MKIRLAAVALAAFVALGAVASAATTLKISADKSNKLAFDKKALTAKSGKVTIVMANPSILPHDVDIKTTKGKKLADGKVVTKGGTSTATAVLKRGTYFFFCSVPGHEAGGMKGTLKVT